MSEEELKAENARLKAEAKSIYDSLGTMTWMNITWVRADSNDILKAKVERLEEQLENMREAGDSLCWYCVRHGQRVSKDNLAEAIEDWNAAKEGKDLP